MATHSDIVRRVGVRSVAPGQIYIRDLGSGLFQTPGQRVAVQGMPGQRAAATPWTEPPLRPTLQDTLGQRGVPIPWGSRRPGVPWAQPPSNRAERQNKAKRTN